MSRRWSTGARALLLAAAVMFSMLLLPAGPSGAAVSGAHKGVQAKKHHRKACQRVK
jgi:hypothetical protein